MDTFLKVAQAIQPAEPRLAYADVANRLRRLILEGQLGVGERLPGEAELCQLFGVSRSTIREAIRVLSAERLLESVRGARGGTFVRQPDIRDISDTLAAMLGLAAGSEGCSIAELVDARKALEVWAAREAAHRLSPAAISELRATLPELGDPLQASRIFKSNRSFHMALLAAAGNGVVVALAEPLFSALHYRVRRPAEEEATWQQVIAEHREIADAIQRRDGDRAAELMSTHLECAKSLYTELERKG